MLAPFCTPSFLIALFLAGLQIRAPSRVSAVLGLVTLVADAKLELQLCLNRSPQSKLGSPTHLILGLSLFARFLLIIVSAM